VLRAAATEKATALSQPENAPANSRRFWFKADQSVGRSLGGSGWPHQVLKIRVSVIRIRPWPLTSHRSRRQRDQLKLGVPWLWLGHAGQL